VIVRTCATCRHELPASEFGVDKRSPDGRHRVCRGCRRGEKLRQRYGLDLAAYDALLRAQAFACAICHASPDTPLHVDHDHDTGQVRGLLCGPCNRAIGALRTVPALAAAIAYLAKNPSN